MTNELTYEQETVRSVFGAYINDLKAYSSKPDRPTFRKLEEVRDKAIKALEQRWIPVSKRLPEKQGCYLVTTKWKGSYSGDVYIETNMAVYREKQKEWDCVDVIAWMPLPEPYKAESGE